MVLRHFEALQLLKGRGCRGLWGFESLAPTLLHNSTGEVRGLPQGPNASYICFREFAIGHTELGAGFYMLFLESRSRNRDARPCSISMSPSRSCREPAALTFALSSYSTLVAKGSDW